MRNFPLLRPLKEVVKAVIRRVYPRVSPWLRGLHRRLESISAATPDDDATRYFWKIHAVVEDITGGEGLRMLTDEGDSAAEFHLIIRRTGRHLRIVYDPERRRHVLSERGFRRWRVLGRYGDHLRAAHACAQIAIREREGSRRLSQLEDAPGGHPIPPMFDVGAQWRSERHRAGWGVAVDALGSLHGVGLVKLDTFVEANFLWQGEHAQVYERPWVGFVHNPPNIPRLACYEGVSNEALFERRAWQDSLPQCQGLFCLSEYHKRHLEKRVPVRAEALVHPTSPPRRSFSFEAFLANPDKQLIQVGVWLRNPLALEKLQTRVFRKVRLHAGIPGHQQVLRSLGGGAFAPSAVDVLPYQDDDAYDELLSRNVVFLNLFDVSAANTVVECIARDTPLLANRLEALEEYLGRDYPLFYEDLDEAGRKSDDLALIRAAHEHLRALPKQRFTPEHFLRSFLDSPIVRSLDVPMRHILVFAQARTGSTNLASALAGHPHVRMLHEPFNPRRAEWESHLELPPVSDLRSLRRALGIIERRYSAFKHLSGQFHSLDRELNHELLRRGYDVILLTRRNLLQGALSTLISGQAGHWGSDRSALLAHRFEAVPLAQLEHELRAREEQAEHYRAFLVDGGIRFLDLSYESLFGPEVSVPQRLAVLGDVFSHLALRMPAGEAIPRLERLLDPAQNKLNTAETYARIPNLAEIERTFAGERWGVLKA